MFEAANNIIFKLELQLEQAKLFITSGVNIFNIDFIYLDIFIIGFIVLLYIGYLLKKVDEDNTNWIEVFIKSLIVLFIVSFIGSKYLQTDQTKIIEGNVFTNNYFKYLAEDETGGGVSQSYIINNNFLLEGIGNNSNKKLDIRGIGGYLQDPKSELDEKQNFLIEQEPVITRYQGVKYSNLIGGETGKLYSYFQNIGGKENFGIKVTNGVIKELDTPFSINYSSPGIKKMLECVKEDPDNIKNCIDFSYLFYGKYKRIDGKLIKERGLTSGFIQTSNTYKLSNFSYGNYKTGNNGNYYIVDTNDLWVWRVMKVDATSGNNKVISFFVVPNLNLLKLEQMKSGSGLMKRIIFEYKSLKSNSCQGKQSCTFQDVYDKKVKLYKTDDVKTFLSAFSIINGGFNSKIENPKNMYSIKINGNDYFSFLGFSEWLMDKGSKTFSLGNNTIGSNFYNNKYILSYITVDDEEEVTRSKYPLGLYNNGSFYKKFYGGVSSDLGIGIGGSIILLVLSLIYTIIIFLSSFFYVYITKQILE